MKILRAILYALILSSLFFAPLQQIKIANLEPVQAVWLYQDNGNIVLETDTEDTGSGSTVEAALEDMKQKSPGIIYLDTAKYLFVAESGQEKMSALSPYLKGSVRVCRWDGQGSIAEAVQYADSHKMGLKLKKWEASSNLPELPPLKGNK